MNQRPSVLHLFAQVWMQNFRRQPLRTVAGTVLSCGLFVALLFFSAFFVLAFLVVGLIGVLYMKVFGIRNTVSYEARYRSSGAKVRPPSSGNILEGEFEEIEAPVERSPQDPAP